MASLERGVRSGLKLPSLFLGLRGQLPGFGLPAGVARVSVAPHQLHLYSIVSILFIDMISSLYYYPIKREISRSIHLRSSTLALTYADRQLHYGD